MMRGWGELATVGLAILVVLIIAHLKPSGADAAEVIWTSLGAAGAVYGWPVWRHRVAVDRWRKAAAINGLFAITSRQHSVLRGVGFWVEVCIAGAGLAAMLNWSRYIIIGLLIVMAALCTFSTWYAERKAEQASRYLEMDAKARVAKDMLDAVERARDAGNC